MAYGDTSIGGPVQPFPNTSWSLIAGFTQGQRPAPQLDALCRRYWKPLYQYLRIAWSKSNDDAKDLTQAFFLWLMEGDALQKYAPQRGGFRTYLKMLLKGFVGHHEEAMARLKRGGGQKILQLDLGEETGRQAADGVTLTPDEVFDRAWMDEVVRLAVDRVRERYSAAGKDASFRAFEEYDLSDSKASYAEAAAKHGMTENAFRSALFTIREAVRTEIRAELADLTADSKELEEEWKALFGK